MAASQSKSSKKQIIDVAKPGKTPAEPTSRPVIITHKSMAIKDPMVNVADKPEPTPEAKPAAPKTELLKPMRTKIVVPLTAAETPPKEKEEAKPKVDDKVEATESTPEDTKTEEAPSESKEEPITEEGVVDAVAEQVNLGNKQKIEDKEELERKAAVAKLIEEKKYILPIKQRSEKHSSKLAVLLLFLILVLGGGYAAADAGYIKLPFALPVQFIPDKAQPAPVAETPVATPKPVSTPVPKPTINTYKSTVDTFSLQYPLTWKISADTLTGSPEYRMFEAAIHANEKKVAKVQFNRLSPTAGSTSFPTQKIVELTNTPFTSGDKQLFITQIVFSDTDKQLAGTRYGASLYVSDQQTTLKVGDMPNDNITFLAKDGKTKLYLGSVLTIVDTDNKTNFATLENLKAYLASDKEFAEALAVMKSVKL